MQSIDEAEILTATAPVSRTSARLDFLDALRGVAALLVVVQHVGERYTTWVPWFTQTWFNFGRFGVTVFFLVSGFVIPYAFEKDRSVVSFWVKRIFRLYPLYWLSLALTVMAHIEPADFPADHFVRDIVVNATMLQGFVGVPNASAPYWTLFIEMAFYLAFTIWFLFHLHRKTMLWAWSGALAFLAVSVLGPALAGAHMPVTKIFCFVAILAGSGLYRHYMGTVSARAIGILLGALALLAAGAAYLNFFKFPSLEHVSAAAVFLSWACALLLFWLVFCARNLTFPPALRWLGKISYSLYLLHAIVLGVTPALGNSILSFCVIIGVSILVSTVSFRYFESPLVSLGHRLASKLQSLES